MNTVKILDADAIGRGFLPEEFLGPDRDEFTIRNQQFERSGEPWRALTAREVEVLVKNGNTADSWEDIRVTSRFDPRQVQNSQFYGLVRIGAVDNVVLEHHDLRLPVGITNSKVVACDIGDFVAIHNVRYLAHYIIGDHSIITNVDEMNTTNHAKFGNGIVKEGEDESVRVTLDVINETGSRAVFPFDGMLPADAYIWAKYRDDTTLQTRLRELTDRQFDSRRGYYGTVGTQSVIKNSRIVKDVKVGPHCYIKGANKLKNLTINSSAEEPTQIGEGVELVNGIIGHGCRIFYGCKAVRFIMGSNCSLKYGARLIHSFMGDNSTVSCCELLNNLIFPSHEQHHNNSFLVAALVLGQSNIAAGATIGSNHNSRSNDNEIQAGRGFWPGLCTSLKHSSRFASFVLLAKADYPAELDVPLPFSLVSNNVAHDRLDVMPAFWWLHNMYALARNSWKYAARDKRVARSQNIEFDSLAPDTVEEIIRARELLELWTGKALADGATGRRAARAGGPEEVRERGRACLSQEADAEDLVVRGDRFEKSRRDAVILHPGQGYRAYGEMLVHYACTNLLGYLEEDEGRTFASMQSELARPSTSSWVNLGGQLAPEADVDTLRADIGAGRLDSWDAVHARYEELWADYPLHKRRHAFAVFCLVTDNAKGADAPGAAEWRVFLDRGAAVQDLVCERVFQSRKKDYDNPFRMATYRNEAEMNAALGTVDENSFVIRVREETEAYRERVARVKARG